jgi:hypothetical protein
MTQSGQLNIGNSGSATVDVLAGGTFTTQSANIAVNASATGIWRT